jgi:hypothetical protein
MRDKKEKTCTRCGRRTRKGLRSVQYGITIYGLCVRCYEQIMWAKETRHGQLQDVQRSRGDAPSD